MGQYFFSEFVVRRFTTLMLRQMEWASNVCVTLSSKRDYVSSRLSNKINTLCQIKFACSLTLFRHHIMICRSINSWKSKCVTLNKCMALLSLPTTPYYVNTWHWIWAMRQNRPGSKFDQRLVESLNSDEDGALNVVVRRPARQNCTTIPSPLPALQHHVGALHMSHPPSKKSQYQIM